MRTAVKELPNFAEAHAQLGRALLAQDKMAEARVAFEKAMQLNPNNPFAPRWAWRQSPPPGAEEDERALPDPGVTGFRKQLMGAVTAADPGTSTGPSRSSSIFTYPPSGNTHNANSVPDVVKPNSRPRYQTPLKSVKP